MIPKKKVKQKVRTTKVVFEGDNERRGADDSPKVLVTKGVVLWKRGLIYVGRTIKKEFCTI